MVDVIGRAKVIITGDVDARSIETSGHKIGSALKTGAVVGVAALGTLAVAGEKAFEAFEEAESASKKLTQVLDNMGKAQAAPAVEKLADDLRKLTGVDDEVIKGGETILATFSEIAKSAGVVGGTFERATRLSVDLAAAGFGDVRSASVQLGKALQDPVKGITALNKSGVTFTEAQKEVIKSLVETGEVGKAQDIILKEVEKQVGGTAEAGAKASDKVKSALGELNETFGKFVDDLISGGDESKTFADRIETLNTQLGELEESKSWKGISAGLRGIGKAIGFVGGLIGDLLTASYNLGGATRDLQTKMDEGWAAIKTVIGDDIDDIVDDIKGFPRKATASVNSWRRAGHDLIQGFWDGVTSKVSGKIGDIVEGLKDALNSSLGLPRTINIPLAPDVHIPAFAGGVQNFGGGLALVGERGPELVGLPAGSDVYNASETQQMLAPAAGNTQNYYITGPVSLAELRQRAAWYDTYGTRFG